MANWHTLQGNFIQGEVSPRFFADVNDAGMASAVAEDLNGVTLLQGNITSRPGSNFVFDGAAAGDKPLRLWPYMDLTNTEGATLWRAGKVEIYPNITTPEFSSVGGAPAARQLANYEQKLVNTAFVQGLSGWTNSGSYVVGSTKYNIRAVAGDLIEHRLTLGGTRNANPDPIFVRQSVGVATTTSIIISVKARSSTVNVAPSAAQITMRVKVGTTDGGSDITTRDFPLVEALKLYSASVNIAGGVSGRIYATFELIVTGLVSEPIDTEERYLCYTSEALLYAQTGGSTAPDIVGTPYSDHQLEALHFIQSPFDNKELIVLHPEFKPHMLYFDGADYLFVPYDFTTEGAGWGPNNYPSIATAYQGRLVLTGAPNDPETVWASKNGDWKDFGFATTPTPDDGLHFTPTERGVNTWLSGFKRLLFGNRGDEYSVDSQSGILQPADVGVAKQSTYGALRNPQKMTIGHSIVLPTSGNSALRMLKYSDENGGFVGPDVLLKADHLGRKLIRRYFHTKDPNDMLWCIMLDGSISLMSFDEALGIHAWSHFTTDGRYTDGCVVADEFGVEHVILIVERVIAGVTKKYVESMGSLRQPSEWQHLDSHVRIYMADDSTTVGGLAHLEAKEVHVFIDDEYMGTRVVTGGIIEIEAPATFVDVGLTFMCRVTTLPENSLAHEVGLTAKKRYSKIGIRGLFTNPPIINGQRPHDRSPQSIMDVPEPVMPLIDSDVVSADWTETGVNTIEEPLPLRMTIAGIYGKLSSKEV